MFNLLKDIVKLGAACLTTYAIVKIVEEVKKPEECVEEVKTQIQHEEEKTEETVEEKKEQPEVKLVVEKERKTLGSIFKKKIENSGIFENANEAIVKAQDTMENANEAIGNANAVLSNANEAIQNINKTISKINNDIENAKKLIFVCITFTCVYKLIK